MTRVLGGVLRGNGVGENRSLHKRIDLDGLDVFAERPFPYQVDGDDLGDTRRLVFHHEPDAIGLVRP